MILNESTIKLGEAKAILNELRSEFTAQEFSQAAAKRYGDEVTQEQKFHCLIILNKLSARGIIREKLNPTPTGYRIESEKSEANDIALNPTYIKS